MNDAVEEPGDGGLAAGAASMRESAKWLVGGVAATAAGVFAGSSLSNLGSLDFVDHSMRLSAAIAGALVGFIALGCIVHRAVAVLTVGSVTFRMLAEAEAGTAHSELKPLADEVAKKYKVGVPLGASSFSDLIDKAGRLAEGDSKEAEVRRYTTKVLGDAAFLSVRRRFVELASALGPATAWAILGFGLFAWAANPPPAAAERPPLLVLHPN